LTGLVNGSGDLIGNVAVKKLLFLLVCMSMLVVSACVETVTPAPPQQDVGEGLPTVTQPPSATPPVLQPTPSVPATPQPSSSGIGSTRLLWEWSEVSRPAAAQPTRDRLAVISADGRFLWINAETGRIQASAVLWPGGIQGDTSGSIIADGSLAVINAREAGISSLTNQVTTSARVIVFDGEASELWSLPELGSQHFYSAVLTTNLVVVGKWPYGFEDNTLTAYEVFTGNQAWQIAEESNGFQQIVSDNARLYVLVNEEEGGAVASYDLRSGQELWRWRDESEEVIRPEQIVLKDQTIYVIGAEQTIALNTNQGNERWRSQISPAPDAGIGLSDNLYYIAPSPAENNTRPGVAALNSSNGRLVWNALAGLVVDPLTVSEETLWAVVKNYDSGEVALSALEADSGLEQVRLRIGSDPNVLYSITSQGQRAFVLGDSLRAYGY